MTSVFASGANVTITDLQKTVLFNGYEEKLQYGDLDVTNQWTETTSGTASRYIDVGRVRLQTGTTTGSKITETLNRSMYIDLDFLGDSNQVYKRLNIEFVMRFNDLGYKDDTVCFVGMAQTASSDRSSNDILGICWSSNSLYLLNDLAGAETTVLVDAMANSTDYKIRLVYENEKFTIHWNGAPLADEISNISFPAVQHLVFAAENVSANNLHLRFQDLRIWFDE